MFISSSKRPPLYPDPKGEWRCQDHVHSGAVIGRHGLQVLLNYLYRPDE